MKIICLVENTSKHRELKTQHGLSFYIETEKQKILFDLGPSGVFLENAKKLGVDISSVDIVIISHGHYDHGRGLETFLKVNEKAKIYIRESAFEPHLYKTELKENDIGLDAELKGNERFVFTKEVESLDEELTVFVNGEFDFITPSGNDSLLKKTRDNRVIMDDFRHEQNLLVTENGKTVLFGGCAHSGIINIINSAKKVTNQKINTIISGFHLYNPTNDSYEDTNYIQSVGEVLKQGESKIYTGHCTGEKAYVILKEILGEQLDYIGTGDILEI